MMINITQLRTPVRYVSLQKRRECIAKCRGLSVVMTKIRVRIMVGVMVRKCLNFSSGTKRPKIMRLNHPAPCFSVL